MRELWLLPVVACKLKYGNVGMNHPWYDHKSMLSYGSSFQLHRLVINSDVLAGRKGLPFIYPK